MIFDEVEKIRAIDKDNFIADIQNLPNQLSDAYTLAKKFPNPRLRNTQSIVIAGMGNSAIAGDILAAYLQPFSDVQIYTNRGYSLPLWVKGENSAVICVSHSGNTEETISVFDQAVKKNIPIMVISTGGRISEISSENNFPLWGYVHNGPPRSAIGITFGYLLRFFEKIGAIENQMDLVKQAIQDMRELREKIDVHIPAPRNPAKRVAGQAMGRIVTVIGSEHLIPVARRWKTQLNEIAKTWSQYEEIPEANHNTIVGTLFPSTLIQKIYTIFLKSKSYHPKNTLRMDLTFTEFMVSGLCTDAIDLTNDGNKLSEIWKAILYGDYVSYYLAIANEIDPTPVSAIDELKESL